MQGNLPFGHPLQFQQTIRQCNSLFRLQCKFRCEGYEIRARNAELWGSNTQPSTTHEQVLMFYVTYVFFTIARSHRLALPTYETSIAGLGGLKLGWYRETSIFYRVRMRYLFAHPQPGTPGTRRTCLRVNRGHSHGEKPSSGTCWVIVFWQLRTTTTAQAKN